MRELHSGNRDPHSAGFPTRARDNAKAPQVFVCLGEDLPQSDLLRPAQLVAQSLSGSLVLVQTIEPPTDTRVPHDPVDWNLQKRNATARLDDLAAQVDDGSQDVETKLFEGFLVDQVCACMSDRPQDITAVFRRSVGFGSGAWDARDPGRAIMEADVGSVLIIPADPTDTQPTALRRILVPLDGSSRAETAIPKAVRIAKANDAEIMLCHATPRPNVAQFGRPTPDTEAMKAQVHANNRRLAQDYLQRIEARLLDCGLSVSTIVSGNGDERRALVGMCEDRHCDLVVLASHGHSNHPDVAAGDMAKFVAGRSPVPVLMVRQPSKRSVSHIYSDTRSRGVRTPTSAMQ